jgi:hypothetical protein
MGEGLRAVVSEDREEVEAASERKAVHRAMVENHVKEDGLRVKKGRGRRLVTASRVVQRDRPAKVGHPVTLVPPVAASVDSVLREASALQAEDPVVPAE